MTTTVDLSFLDKLMLPAGDALTNLVKSFPGIYQLIGAFCYLAALVFIVIGIRRLAVVQQNKGRSDETHGGVIAALLFGALLAYVPELMNAATCTAATRYSTSRMFDYVQHKHEAPANLGAVFDLVRLIGLVSFIKSLMLMRQIAHGIGDAGRSARWGQAFWMMIGGVAAWNIIPTISILAATFGIPGGVVASLVVEQAGTQCMMN